MEKHEAVVGGQSYLLQDIRETHERLSLECRRDLGVVLSFSRAFRGDRRAHIGYATVAVTTGKRFYDVLSREGVLTREELIEKRGKDFLYEEIVKPNIEESTAFVNQLCLEEDRLFIAPSAFDARPWKWTDDAYMALWYRVIAEMAGKHRLSPNWAYSYGGAREALFSLMLQFRVIRRTFLWKYVDHFGLQDFLNESMSCNEITKELQKMWAIRLYDQNGELSLMGAITECTRTIADLHARGFNVDNLIQVAWKMKHIPAVTPSFYEPYPCFTTAEMSRVTHDLEVLTKKIKSSPGH